MKNNAKMIILFFTIMLSVFGIVHADEQPNGDISFIKTENGIAAKAYRQDSSDTPCQLFLAVYEDGIMKNAVVSAATTESVLTTDELPFGGKNETVKAFFVTNELFPVSRVYSPMEETPDFTISASVYGKSYQGRVNREKHTITFDVPKTLAEDYNSSVPREKDGYLPIGNFHFDKDYTIALQGASASYDGKTVQSGTVFPIGGDHVIAVTDKSGKTEDYTLEMHISETANVAAKEGGFTVSEIPESSTLDKLTVNTSFTVQSDKQNEDLYCMGFNAFPLSLIVTTKEQSSGSYTLRVGGNQNSVCVLSSEIPVLKIGTAYNLTYIFRKTSDSGMCELYVNNKLIAMTQCSGVSISDGDYAFYTERINDNSGSITLSNNSASIVRPRAELYVEKLPNGKNSAYTFTGDDGYVNSAKWYYNTFKELGLKGSLALNSSKTDAAGLRPYVSDGILDIGNHGKTHKILTGLDDSALDDEVEGGQKDLREMFEGSSVLTMYLPNNQRSDKVLNKLKESHYAVRCSGSNKSNSLYLGKDGLYTTSFYAVNGAGSSTKKTELASLKWRIDDARSNGRWMIDMWHEVSGSDVEGEPNLKAPYVYDSTEAKTYFKYVASHLDEMYCGGYETMVQYILERDYLRMQKLSSADDEIKYRAEYDKSMLIKAEDAAYFNTPLTINAVIPDNWERVLVTQNGKETVYPIYKEQSAVLGAKERNYVLFDVVPDGTEITLKPVSKDYEILGDKAEVTAAKIKIGDNTYDATVNTETKEINFAFPYASLKSELTDALGGKKSPAIMPDLSAVQITLYGEGKMTVNGERVEKTFTVDADELKEISVEAKNLRYTYKVNILPMMLVSRYNTNGAELTSTTETQASRRGVPKSLANGNVYSGNFGDSVWRINQSGMAYNADGTVDADNTYASLSIESKSDNNNDQYIRLNKFKSTQGTSAKVWLYRQSNYGNTSDIVRTKLKFNLFNFTKNNSGMVYLWTSDLDQIVLSSNGMANNSFKLCHRGTNTDNMIDFSNTPILETNTWYTLVTEFHRSEESENGYYIDVFLQKENEDTQYLGRISDQKSCPTGIVAYPKNEFMMQSWSNAVFELGIDDYEVMTSENSDKYDTTVHLLGDSICRYYDTQKLAPQQGWGTYVHDMFKENVRVLNYSVGGYNTNIYLDGAKRSALKSAPIIPSLCRTLDKGDYVVVALGWNEANSVDGSWNTVNFKNNLKKIADACKEKGATVIFITSTPNLKTDYSGLANSCLTGLGHTMDNGEREYVYPVTDMKNFASENGYVCLDLNTAMYERLESMSADEYKEIFTGTSSVEPNNSINKDYLHITEKGAELAGNLIKELLKESTSPLKEYLKEG